MNPEEQPGSSIIEKLRISKINTYKINMITAVTKWVDGIVLDLNYERKQKVINSKHGFSYKYDKENNNIHTWKIFTKAFLSNKDIIRISVEYFPSFEKDNLIFIKPPTVTMELLDINVNELDQDMLVMYISTYKARYEYEFTQKMYSQMLSNDNAVSEEYIKKNSAHFDWTNINRHLAIAKKRKNPTEIKEIVKKFSAVIAEYINHKIYSNKAELYSEIGEDGDNLVIYIRNRKENIILIDLENTINELIYGKENNINIKLRVLPQKGLDSSSQSKLINSIANEVNTIEKKGKEFFKKNCVIKFEY